MEVGILHCEDSVQNDSLVDGRGILHSEDSVQNDSLVDGRRGASERRAKKQEARACGRPQGFFTPKTPFRMTVLWMAVGILCSEDFVQNDCNIESGFLYGDGRGRM